MVGSHRYGAAASVDFVDLRIRSGIIVAAIVALGLTGTRLEGVFGRIGNVVSSVTSQNDKSPYCPANSRSIADVCNPATIPPPKHQLVACAPNGVSGVAVCDSVTGKAYAGLLAWSSEGVTPPASGTLFLTGFSFNSAYVNQTGLYFSDFSNWCKSGYTGEYPTGGPNTVQSNYYGGYGYGPDRIHYSSGKPAVDSSGKYVCSGASVLAGYLG